MKSTGIVRNLDSLGRIVIPMELRRTLNIDTNAAIEIYTDGERIVLQKHSLGCYLCGDVKRPSKMLYPDKPICSGCVGIIVKAQEELTK